MDAKEIKAKTVKIISCITMIMALAWLTVSLPFVYHYQQTAEQTKDDTNSNKEKTGNPLTNSTEEKNESKVSSVSEEYLHNRNEDDHYLASDIKYFKCHPSDLYFDFHPELISPPPEA